MGGKTKSLKLSALSYKLLTMKRIYLYIAVILMFLAGCKKEQAVQPAPVPEAKPSQSIEGFKLTETQAGKRSWVLVADSANTFNEKKLVELFKMKIDFYRKAGDSINATLTADSGKINTGTRNMEARRNVVLASQDGLILYTDYLNWTNEGRRLTTESKVRLERGKDWLTGEGLEASPDLKEIEVKRNVQGKKELLTGLEGLK
jgi:LPS export ABC transporter protein LptC